MGLKIVDLKVNNYKDFCFSSTGKRENVKFLDHGDPGYRQVYELGLFDSEVFNLKEHPHLITQQKVNYYSDRKQVIKDKKQDIIDHLDMRLALYFEQAILCHKTPFVFSSQGAEDQIGVGTFLKKNGRSVHKTQAAHPSTLPCLHASFRDNPNETFVFLKHSKSYTRQNSTNELPEEVNQTDTLLDGKETENKLRNAALKILNDDAEGKIDPTKAMKRFLKVFQGRLETQISALAKTDVRRKVAKIYLEQVKKVREDIKGSDEIFDLIMGVKLPADQTLRRVVYKRRYQELRDIAHVESQISMKIFKAEGKMLGTRVKSLKSVAIPLRYILIQGAASKAEQIFYEKFFSTSLDQLNSHFENKEKKLRIARNEVTKLEQNYKNVIKDLRKEVDELRTELEFLKIEARSYLFKELRTDYRNWTQHKFVTKFKELYPNDTMSQSTVSRLEFFTRHSRKEFYETPECQRKKEISISVAQKIATTFEIDPGLFLASSY